MATINHPPPQSSHLSGVPLPTSSCPTIAEDHQAEKEHLEHNNKGTIRHTHIHIHPLIYMQNIDSLYNLYSMVQTKDAFIMQLDSTSTSMQRQPICVSDGSGLYCSHTFCRGASHI